MTCFEKNVIKTQKKKAEIVLVLNYFIFSLTNY